MLIDMENANDNSDTDLTLWKSVGAVCATVVKRVAASREASGHVSLPADREDSRAALANAYPRGGLRCVK